MRRWYKILMLVTIVLVAGSCNRRPLVEMDNNVLLNISIGTDIVNYELKSPPQMMRAIFFDSQTGETVSHSFLRSQGGFVNVTPGREYDILVYNFDTGSTIIGGDNNLNYILACTDLVPENIKSEFVEHTGNSEDERFVYEPDHLFVGKLEDVYVPVQGYGMPAFQIDIHAETLVETWVVEIDKVRGAEHVGTVSSVISGLADHTLIGLREPSCDEATVYLKEASLTKDGHFYAKFNTFGRNVLADRQQILSLVLTDTDGESFIFSMDITERFKDNPLQYILIKTDDIEIGKTENLGGGGYAL